VTDPRILWWVDRSAGLVSFVMLTVVLAVGVLSVGRPPRLSAWRAGAQALHRELPLVAALLLVVHIGTAVADTYVPLRLRDVLVPFGAAWRPLWVGFGALAVDLLVVLLVTSLLRSRLSTGAWRAVHLTAYLLWPLAAAHALGAGTDAGTSAVRWIGVGCVGAVALALVRRVQLVVVR
jgi:predicted ferric reductase